MRRKYKIARARLGENLGAGALTAGTVFMLAAALFFATGTGAQAAEKGEPPVLFQEAVSIPVAAANTTGGLYAFDISWVEQTTQTYYLADRSNFAIDVVNAKTDTFVKQISATPSFAGATANPETSGPNGVLTARGCIIATDAPRTKPSRR